MLNDLIMDSKECTRCGETKPLDQFFPLYGKQKEIGARNGRTHRSYCKKCNGKEGRDYKRNNPDARKRYSSYRRKMTIRQKYGLTEERYFEILHDQGGGCAICRTAEGRKLKKLSKTKFNFAVDHDHDSGKTRGLLCDTCNRALGMFGDSPENLRSAIVYLEKHGKS